MTMHIRLRLRGWGVWRRAILGAGIALAGNLAVWALATVAGVSVQVPESPGSSSYVDLSLPPLILATIVPAAVGGGGLLVLRRLTPENAVRAFLIVGTISLLLSLAGPLGLATGIGSRFALMAMHVVTAVAIVGAQSWAVSGTAVRPSASSGMAHG